MATVIQPDPCLLVIFGASGDLTQRKLIPSLYELYCDGYLPEPFAVLGVSRSDLGDAGFRQRMRDELSTHRQFDEQTWRKFEAMLFYHAADATDHDSFATVKHLSSKQILKIEIPLPPLSEQRRIVDILNRANGIRRFRWEAQKKARQVIPALFMEMFGDPQRNPKGWPGRPLGDISNITYGIADKLNTSLGPQDGTRILTISNVRKDGSIDRNIERRCPRAWERKSRSRARPPTQLRGASCADRAHGP